MQLTPMSKIILYGGSFFIVILIIIFVVMLVMGGGDEPAENTNVNAVNSLVIIPTNSVMNTNTELVNTNANVNVNTNANTNENTNTIIPEPINVSTQERRIIRSSAVSFAQIFGSYSTHNPFANVESARILMSESMKTWADDLLAKNAGEGPTEAYYGIETYALSTDITAYEKEKSATVVVSTQRKESVGTTANKRVYHQDIELELVTEQGLWKVNRATWIE